MSEIIYSFPNEISELKVLKMKLDATQTVKLFNSLRGGGIYFVSRNFNQYLHQKCLIKFYKLGQKRVVKLLICILKSVFFRKFREFV